MSKKVGENESKNETKNERANQRERENETQVGASPAFFGINKYCLEVAGPGT